MLGTPAAGVAIQVGYPSFHVHPLAYCRSVPADFAYGVSSLSLSLTGIAQGSCLALTEAGQLIGGRPGCTCFRKSAGNLQWFACVQCRGTSFSMSESTCAAVLSPEPKHRRREGSMKQLLG